MRTAGNAGILPQQVRTPAEGANRPFRYFSSDAWTPSMSQLSVFCAFFSVQPAQLGQPLTHAECNVGADAASAPGRSCRQQRAAQ